MTIMPYVNSHLTDNSNTAWVQTLSAFSSCSIYASYKYDVVLQSCTRLLVHRDIVHQRSGSLERVSRDRKQFKARVVAPARACDVIVLVYCSRHNAAIELLVSCQFIAAEGHQPGTPGRMTIDHRK